MQVRAARTRQALINAAAKLIDDRGMKGTGLLDVSRAAGVSKGALYFHFASKDELITAVTDEARCSVRALAAEHLDGQSSTLAGAARFTAAMSRRMREDHVLRAGLRLESEGAVSKVTGGESLRETWLSTLRGRLAKDAAEGALRQGADARDTANLLAAVTVGLESLGREDDSWWDPEVTSGIWQLLMLFAGPQQQPEQVTRLTGEPETAHHRETGPAPERERLGEVRELTPSVPGPSSPADLMEVAGAARAS